MKGMASLILTPDSVVLGRRWPSWNACAEALEPIDRSYGAESAIGAISDQGCPTAVIGSIQSNVACFSATRRYGVVKEEVTRRDVRRFQMPLANAGLTLGKPEAATNAD